LHDPVVGLVVGQVDLQEVQAAVDGVDQAQASGQQVDGADAAGADAAAAAGDLVMDVAGGEHGSVAATDIGPVQAAFDAALVVVQASSYDGFHSKSLCAWGVGTAHHSSDTAGKLRDFAFSQPSGTPTPGDFACSRTK
jgi:hypothetical protein